MKSILLYLSVGALLLSPLQAFTQSESFVTFEYMGDTLTYGTVEYNGKIWMDRNLGAERVARSHRDVSSYGDLFQWGRGADGHQSRESMLNDTLASPSEQPGHGDFIVNHDHPHDWNESTAWTERGWIKRNNEKTQWDPCPTGWRVPREEEWEDFLATGIQNGSDAFKTPLKLPCAGFRSHYGGKYAEGTYGFYWSSSPMGVSGMYMSFYDKVAYMNYGNRTDGFSVRCIKKTDRESGKE